MGNIINLSEKTDLQIRNINDLQIALMEDNNPAIKNYIERLDRESSNEMMKTSGDVFGFPTVEIEGVMRTSLGHLAGVFGYKKPHALQELLSRRGISGIKMGGFTYDTCIEIRRGLALDANDNSAILHDYPAFLIGGMNSTNDEARKVQLYLLRCERIARVGIVATRESSLPSIDNSPQPIHAMVKAKLAKEAWRGNPIAAYLLEHDYAVPVSELMRRTDPELSEMAGTISQYFHFIKEDNPVRFGIRIEETPTGYFFQEQTETLYNAFLEISRRHNLKIFFGNIQNLGTILVRESDALELLGWRRTIKPKIRNGIRRWKWEYTNPAGRPDEE